MILTCPACDTKYVVKDDAIPPGGRQVRCASCKHSWHQDPEGMVVAAESVAVDFAGPPEPAPEIVEQPFAEAPPEAVEEGLIAGEPQPEVVETYGSDWALPSAEGPIEPPPADEVSMEEAPAVADEWRRSEPAAEFDPGSETQAVTDEAPALAEDPPLPAEAQAPAVVEAPAATADEEFVGYAPIEDEERPRRRWPLILGLLALIAVAAAAFWFLAPPEWKQRAGIAQAGATPLQLMITTNDRQPLESGNELIAISGRVINPTDQEQNVPPIHAELRDKQSKAVVHRWTIAPPARVLAPRSSASFNSAEIDVPKGGDELTITLGQVEP
ncbi:zinc-ribbon domain-containing protein [Sphingomonas sp. RB56-2]|uniref:Zinc-ribbon domain-containing protein n=1 Tax=Sphingomonas brevis TaxID=2908206 RepID=A0ABT0SB96_9SPHN|nr:zinc-ribbon domain-containing protein [Sphingomonas brevis]MCL6741627.1 zinc-ribbon domain-containing protein [Sphingomonas brevis]